MKKKKPVAANFLEKIPAIKQGLNWSKDDSGIVTLEKENKGFVNRAAQKLLKKPKISYIHLERMGSFIWLNIDGESDILKIGETVKAHFGEEAEPLYERLVQYLKNLEAYGFIEFKE